MRTVVQGADAASAWDRYLQIEGSHRDARTVRRTLAWIRDAFAAAARRERRPGTAKLVAVDIDKLPPAPSEVVTLETFIVSSGLEAFSQRVQLAAFKNQYGNVSMRQSRRARLMAKQLEALRWLEALIAEPPAAGDPLVCWINPDLAAHSNQAGLLTLRQLIDHINGTGKRWHTSVAAIGAGKAQRITDWLRLHEASLGAALGSHVRVSHAQLAPGAFGRPCSSACWRRPTITKPF